MFRWLQINARFVFKYICVKYLCLNKYWPPCHLPLAYEGSLPRRKSSRNWGLHHTIQFTPHYTVPHEATPWTVRLFCEYVPMSHTPHHPLYATLPMYYTVPHHNHLAAWHTTHTTSERHTAQLYLSICNAFCYYRDECTAFTTHSQTFATKT